MNAFEGKISDLAQEWLRLDKVACSSKKRAFFAHSLQDPSTRAEIEALLKEGDFSQLQKRLDPSTSTPYVLTGTDLDQG